MQNCKETSSVCSENAQAKKKQKKTTYINTGENKRDGRVEGGN